MFESGAERDGDGVVVPWLDVANYDVDEFDDVDLTGTACHVREVFSRPVGPWLLTGVLGVDAGCLSADDAITYLQQVNRAAAWLAGVQTQVRKDVTDRVVAHFAEERAGEDVPPVGAAGYGFVSAEDLAAAEIAAACRQSPRASDARIQESVDLTGPWQPMLDALLAGEVSIEHVRAIGRELRRAPGYGDTDAVEARRYARTCAKVLKIVVPFAKEHSPGQSARKTALLVVAADPAAARKKRREVAEAEHNVYLTSGEEPGTCQVTAVMPTAHGHAVMDAVNALANDTRFEVSDGCVTKGQRRVAAFATLILGDPGRVGQVTGPVAEAKVNAHVNVLVSLETLTGVSEQGGRINTTAVQADVVRDTIAACGSSSTIRRLVTDPAGVILDAGRSHYLGSDVQKLVVKLRDGYCRAVACDTPAWTPGTEIDHATPWGSGGETNMNELGALCKHHHQIKTHGGWALEATTRRGDGTWRSPLGRIYQHTAPDLLPPPPEPDPDPPPF